LKNLKQITKKSFFTGIWMRVSSVVVLLVDQVAHADGCQTGYHEEDAQPTKPD